MIQNEGLFRHPGDTGSEELIQATAFGGLNTIANVLNMPYNDAHRLTNVDVTDGANLVKRKGTRLLGRTENDTLGVSFTRVLSASGLSFVVAKLGTSIVVYSVTDDEMSELIEFENVWAPTTAPAHVNVVSTNEPEQRFIMLSSTSVPVHVRMVERAVRIESAAASTVVEDERFANGTPGVDFVAYVNNEPQSALDITSDATSATLTAPVVAGDVVTFLYFYWQWWAEAELYNTDRFSVAVTRFHIDNSDRSVAVPLSLQDDIELDTYGLYRLYSALNQSGREWDFPRWRRPSTNGTYMPSDGSLNFVEGNGGELAVPGTRTILFGKIYPEQEPGVPEDPFLIYITAIRKLSHNDYQGIKPEHLHVEYSDFTNTREVEWIPGQDQDATKPYGFQLYDGTNWIDPDVTINTPDAPGSQFTNFPLGSPESIEAAKNRMPVPLTADFTGKATHMHFGLGERRGLPASAIVRIVNTEPRWLGSAALSTNTAGVSGTWFPAYGIGRFANYNTGSFPSTGAIFQGRMALGGFPGRPMDVLISSIRDFGWPGELFNDFTIDAFSTASNNAFDVVLPGSTSEIIQTMGVYQGSLFVGGTASLHRVFSRTVFDQGNFITQFVGAVGALNPQSMITTVDAGFLLSSSGVYAIMPSDGLDDAYVAQSISFKVSTFFNIDNVRNLRRLSSMGYDPTTKKLYVSLAEQNTGDNTVLLVFFAERGAWTQYSFLTGTQVRDMTTYRDNDGTERFLLVQDDPGGPGSAFLRTEYEYPIDFGQEGYGGSTVSLSPRPSQTITTTAGSVRYEHDIVTSGFNNVEDLEVSLDENTLVFGTEWVKTLQGTVTLLITPNAGQTLRVQYVNPTQRLGSDREYHHEAIRKNLVQTDRAAGTYSIDDETGIVTLIGDPTERFILGLVMATEYRTPVYAYGNLKQYKRFRNWVGLFDRAWYGEIYSNDTPGLTDAEKESNILGRLRIRQDVNLAIIYNNERDGSVDQDIFRLTQLLFDISQFDYLDGAFSERGYANVAIPIQGAGYSIQASLWSHDDDAWALSGYQLDGKRKAKRYRTGE